jgi:hypothetical protein
MAPWRRGGRLAGKFLTAAGLLGGTAGCLSFVHPVGKVEPERAASCAAVPQCARNHVHIFLLHGLDPLDLANLQGVRDYVQSLGFLKTHYGQWFHQWQFRDEIRKIHQDDPDARFVVVGFSFGACMARDLVNAVADVGVQIDLLVYLGGCILRNTPETRPEHAIKVVNILALGCIFNGAKLDNADNINYDNVFHFGSPAHPRTLELLANELAVIAERVPVPAPPDPPPPLEEAPRPRPLHEKMPRAEPEGQDEWDFLKLGPTPEIPPPRPEDEKYKRPSAVYRPDPGLTRNPSR